MSTVTKEQLEAARLKGKYPDHPLDKDRIELNDDVSFVLDGEIITKGQMDLEWEGFRGYAVGLLIGSEWFGRTRDQFLRLLYDVCPLVLKTAPDTRFTVEWKEFQYEINGKRDFAAFSCRLIPIRGGVLESRLKSDVYTCAVDGLDFSVSKIDADFGNGHFHIEIFLNPTTETLGKLRPPLGFKGRYWTQPASGDALYDEGDWFWAEPFNDFWKMVEREYPQQPSLRLPTNVQTRWVRFKGRFSK